MHGKTKRSHPEPAVPSAKKAKGDEMMLQAMFRTLPAEAQQEGYDGSRKSYTLKDPNDEAKATIGVLLYR